MSDALKPDAASILFPNDVPAASQAPEWFKNERAQASARLAGLGNLSKPVDAPKPDPAAGSAKPDDAASRLFPSDKPGAAEATEKKSDFPEDPAKGYEQAGSSFDALRLAAISDGETERADELLAARDGLIANARDAGTPPDELESAMGIVRERASDAFMTPPTAETLAAEMNTNLDTLKAELGDGFEQDLSLARRLIQDVEKIAPGTLASLEASGAGNDLRLIRSVIREAKRRGYR